MSQGELVDAQGVFHLSTPVAKWWDNVIFACSSFQPFRTEQEVLEHRQQRAHLLKVGRHASHLCTYAQFRAELLLLPE